MDLAADRVLVVAAHPDDEVLGPGGTVKLLAGMGARIRTVIACNGRPGREELVEEIARRVGVSLGVERVMFLRYPNLRLETFALAEVTRRLEGIIEEGRPTMVLTLHGGDLNRDHRTCFDAVLTASRPTRGCPVRSLLCFETLSSTEWAGRPGDAFEPNVYVDITATFEAKTEAVAAYQPELRPYPYPRSIEGVEA
ncbi:MAG TPA: PIG-L family deacetylase, partial [Bacillota bacterium]